MKMAVSTASHSLPQRPGTNALSSKATSVLAASYADADIKNALALLDDRNVQNTAETRRQLRLDIQKDVIESNGAIIREFGHVAEQLKRIGQSIASLNEGCAEMRKHINAARQETRPMMDEASDLMEQRVNVEAKQQLLQAFNAHFVISEHDISILTSVAEPVDDAFFDVLVRAKTIQKDCEVLLGTEDQRLGQEIMDQTTKNINAAFQKLYRWVQREFESINLENPQINASLRRALRVLAERSSLFQSCLDAFAETREQVLSDSFYTALTGSKLDGQEVKSVKPIELAAHDPLRYVGDMLAWTHSATVSEREALEVLFISEGDEIAKGIQAGRDNEPWRKYVDDDETEPTHSFDGVKALNELVDRDMAGVAQVLRQRVGQVVQSHEETIMAYKIANLLEFYHSTFSKLLGEGSVLLDTLTSLEESALRQFRSLLGDHVASITAEPQKVPRNLAPPDFFLDSLKQLTDIMKTFDTSMSAATDREAYFKQILDEAFMPFFKTTETMASAMTDEPFKPTRAIFTTNCVLAAQSILSVYEFTTSTVAGLGLILQDQAAKLTEHQHSFLLQSSGIKPLLTAHEEFMKKDDADLKTLPSDPAFNPVALSNASQQLDDFLPSALMDAIESLRELQSTKIATEVTNEAAELFIDEFERLEEALIKSDELNGFGPSVEDEVPDGEGALNGGLRALFPRTSGEIRVLLS